MSVGNIRKLQENTVALYTERKTLLVNAFKRSKYVYPKKLKCPPLPFGCEISGCKMSAHGILPRVDWAMTRKGDRLRVQGVGTPIPDDTKRPRLSGSTPSGFPKRTRAAMLSGATPSRFPKEAHDTRDHHTPDDSISYPDRLSGWKTLTKVSKPCYVIDDPTLGSLACKGINKIYT